MSVITIHDTVVQVLMQNATGEETGSCAVCHDDLTEGVHELGCGHRFHTACVLNWFRRGAQTCPSCRDPGLRAEDSPIGALSLHARASTLRKLSQRKSAPKKLVALVRKVKRAEQNLVEAKVAVREHRLENKNVLAISRRLHTKEFKCRRHLSDDIRVLGLYQDDHMRLPALLVNSQNPNDFRSRP